MRYDLIQKVEFFQLDPRRSDRRGTIAVFHLKKIENIEYLYTSAAIVIRQIIGLLHDHFEMNWYDTDNIRSYALGEAQDCWLNHGYTSPQALVLTHKYWGEEQIEAFYQLITILGKLHGWEIIDNRKAQNNG